MSEKIEEGDDVLFLLDNRRSYLVRAERGRVLHTHKGFIKIDEVIGKEFGVHVKSSMGVDFVALKPSLKDYIFKISRRTQIIYPKDIALIIFFGNIKPGSVVVEAGTGAGALTTALANYVKPSGRVYSYEIRSEFIEVARKNLKRAGVLDYVELKNKDVTRGIDERNVDAVILDMATPWLVVPHAYNSLKGSGSFVSFSPTIDQVVKTVEELKANEFTNIETIECFIRRIRVEKGRTRPETLMTGHTGYMVFARKSLKPESPKDG